MRSAIDGLNILVVDDDPQMLRTLGDILRLRGYAALTAPTGERGLEEVGSLDGMLAIALVDLRLPDMDGIELVHRLHEISDMTEVVILTGNASLETAVKALREQTFDYLLKPVQPAQLLDTLEKATERWRRKVAETALGESEERLRRMFEAIADAVFITDAHGRFVDANPAAIALSGMDVPVLRTRMLRDLFRREKGAPSATPQLTTPAAPSLPDGEYILTTRDGRSLLVEMRSAAFSMDRFVHTARDQTERHRLEEQLKRAQRMEAVGQLAGGLAHDFNNVLTAITGYAELLTWELPEGSTADDHVKEILQAAQRAGRLTKELLTFSRRQIFVPKVLDLNEVVSGLDTMVRRLVRENVTMSVALGSELGCVKADRGRLEQVLVNLVVNAGDAMPEGGRLTIRTEAVSAVSETDAARVDGVAFGMGPGPYVALVVEDTGVGMDSETLDQIFQPFFTTKEPGKGTGLGLATTYGIVKQSGGHIQVESVPGKGSRFTVFLPQVDGEPEDERPEGGRTIAPTGSETVLVAEDDPTVRLFVRKALEMHGYTVLAADHPETALAVARDWTSGVHVLVTDLVMPGLGGPELARRVREIHPSVKVLVTTGYSPEHTEYGVLDESDGFLEKPFRMERLLQEVRRVLDTEVS